MCTGVDHLATDVHSTKHLVRPTWNALRHRRLEVGVLDVPRRDSHDVDRVPDDIGGACLIFGPFVVYANRYASTLDTEPGTRYGCRARLNRAPNSPSGRAFFIPAPSRSAQRQL